MCFWGKYSEKTDTFGHIPSSKESRGFCGIFYDLSPKVSLPNIAPKSVDYNSNSNIIALVFVSKNTSDKQKKDNHVLMTVLAGNAAVEAQEMEDKEIVDRCLNLLKSMFPNEVCSRLYLKRGGSV